MNSLTEYTTLKETVISTKKDLNQLVEMFLNEPKKLNK